MNVDVILLLCCPYSFRSACNLEDRGFTVVLGVTDDLASCSVLFCAVFFFHLRLYACLLG